MNSKFKKIMAYSLSTALIVTSCFTMGLSKKTSQVKADETANTTSYEAVKSFDFSSGTQDGQQRDSKVPIYHKQ